MKEAAAVVDKAPGLHQGRDMVRHPGQMAAQEFTRQSLIWRPPRSFQSGVQEEHACVALGPIMPDGEQWQAALDLVVQQSFVTRSYARSSQR
jgi:hypothetical protein